MLAPTRSRPAAEAAKEVDGPLYPEEGVQRLIEYPRKVHPRRSLVFRNFCGAFGVSAMIEYTFVL
jgi:hypothetical protein